MTLMIDLSQGSWRLMAFLGVFVLMAVLERFAPRRPMTRSRVRRWTTNLMIGVIDSSLLRAMAQLAIPVAAVAASVHAEAKGWGLFNLIEWPATVEMLIAIVVLDGAIYVQHVASHRVPVLWRLHRVHHADPELDVTSAIRFHPIEIALSMLYKIVLAYALGPSPAAVVLFEVLLNASAMFNHANLRLPDGIERRLRLVVVTPDMHRVHHSVLRREHDTNYGFNLSFWDRLFGTYTAEPEHGHIGMRIGLADYQDERPTQLAFSLGLPFAPAALARLEARGQEGATASKPGEPPGVHTAERKG